MNRDLRRKHSSLQTQEKWGEKKKKSPFGKHYTHNFLQVRSKGCDIRGENTAKHRLFGLPASLSPKNGNCSQGEKVSLIMEEAGTQGLECARTKRSEDEDRATPASRMSSGDPRREASQRGSNALAPQA